MIVLQLNVDLVSNSIVVYLRLLTSAQMRSEPEKYADVLFHPELDEPMELREFCENFVEAVGKEAGEHLLAITIATHVAQTFTLQITRKLLH